MPFLGQKVRLKPCQGVPQVSWVTRPKEIEAIQLLTSLKIYDINFGGRGHAGIFKLKLKNMDRYYLKEWIF